MQGQSEAVVYVNAKVTKKVWYEVICTKKVKTQLWLDLLPGHLFVLLATFYHKGGQVQSQS